MKLGPGQRLAVLLAVALGLSACGEEAKPPAGLCQSMSVGEQRACAVCDEKLACWGGKGSAGARAQPTRRLTAVAVGSATTCALDAEGAQCWPDTANDAAPRRWPGRWEALANFDDRPCLLGAGSVQCEQVQGAAWVLPGLAHPRRIAAGRGRVCVLDDAGVRCWALGGAHEPLRAPLLANPIGLAAGNAVSCASDGRAIVCAEANEGAAPITLRPSAGGSVRSLAMNPHDDVCALVDGALQCWDRGGQPKPGAPGWRDLKQVAVGDAQVCALSAEGRVRCAAFGTDASPRRSSGQAGSR